MSARWALGFESEDEDMEEDVVDDEPCRDRRRASCRSCSKIILLKRGPMVDGYPVRGSPSTKREGR
jgi:hypothetical protein